MNVSHLSTTLAAVVLVLAVAPLAGEAPVKSDQALQARAILNKYCVECHHPEAGHKGRISVADRAGITLRFIEYLKVAFPLMLLARRSDA